MSFRLNFQPILTLIYNPKCSKSNKALQILNETLEKEPDIFKLDVLDYQKQPLTNDQLRSIVDYLGIKDNNGFSSILRSDDASGNVNNNISQKEGKGNTSATATNNTAESPNIPLPSTTQELLEIVKQQPIRLQRPILVDWNKGKAIIARPPEKITDFLYELDTQNPLELLREYNLHKKPIQLLDSNHITTTFMNFASAEYYKLDILYHGLTTKNINLTITMKTYSEFNFQVDKFLRMAGEVFLKGKSHDISLHDNRNSHSIPRAANRFMQKSFDKNLLVPLILVPSAPSSFINMLNV
ncbi:2585_t:CDS:2 [Entrophospora sp. SA101]|nr:1420_t:CDS:2 [Entrophospora sp. SA101]CAJ0831208.1 2585_t:CDS:2 [Entrophospora sp. SA101]